MKKLLFFLPLLAFVFLGVSDVVAGVPVDVGKSQVISVQDAGTVRTVVQDLQTLDFDAVLNVPDGFKPKVLSVVVSENKAVVFYLISWHPKDEIPPLLFYICDKPFSQNEIMSRSDYSRLGYSMASMYK